MPVTLRDEIRQAKPFSSLEQEAFLNVLRTAATLEAHFEQLLKPAGITAAQYNVLRILEGAEPEGLCRNEVRERMLTRMPDMTRLLDRMETAGLVVRARDDEDRRMVTTRITAKGRRVLDSLHAAVQREHRKRLGHLGEARLRTLIGTLTAVRHPR